jgi:hypothetical protein
MTPIRPTSLANRINAIPPTIYQYLFNEIGYVLMSPLNIHPEEDQRAAKKKNNKLLKALLGISALIAVPVIGTTLAASITIGSGAIQFGQGVQQATACDPTITVTAASSFANTTGAGSYNMGDVVISEILNACNAKKFTVSLFGDSSDTAVATCVVDNLNGSGSATAVTNATACNSGTGGVKYTSTVSSDANTLTVRFGDASSAIAASGVYKITVQTA